MPKAHASTRGFPLTRGLPQEASASWQPASLVSPYLFLPQQQHGSGPAHAQGPRPNSWVPAHARVPTRGFCNQPRLYLHSSSVAQRLGPIRHDNRHSRTPPSSLLTFPAQVYLLSTRRTESSSLMSETAGSLSLYASSRSRPRTAESPLLSEMVQPSSLLLSNETP